MAQDGFVAALDIGCSKVSCLIAERSGADIGRIRGMGIRANEGVRGGALINADLAEESIRGAVGQAEKMAGSAIEDVWISLSAGNPESHMIDISMPMDGQPVGHADIDAAMDVALEKLADRQPEILHAFPAAYATDDVITTSPPHGLYPDELTVFAHVITASASAQKNLETVLRAAHLRPAGFVAQPLASGLGCLVDDELKIGAACIDIGAGTTGIGLFANTTMGHCEVIPSGSDILVKAIAGHFVTTLTEAARVLALYGAALHDPSDDRHMIDVKVLDGAGVETETQFPRRDLTLIIEDTLRAFLLELAERLTALGFDPASGQRLVLTGSAAQLSRLPELARQCFRTGVRVGLPPNFSGLPVSARGPGFSASVGLLRYGVDPDRFLHMPSTPVGVPAASAMKRLWHWVKGNI